MNQICFTLYTASQGKWGRQGRPCTLKLQGRRDKFVWSIQSIRIGFRHLGYRDLCNRHFISSHVSVRFPTSNDCSQLSCFYRNGHDLSITIGTESGTLVQMQLIISLVFSLIRRFSGTWVQSVHSVCSPVQGEQSR